MARRRTGSVTWQASSTMHTSKRRKEKMGCEIPRHVAPTTRAELRVSCS